MFMRLSLAAAVVLAACTPTSGPAPGGSGAICPQAGVFRPGAATFAFTGDVMAHILIQQDAARRPEGFAPALAPSAPFLRRADVTVVNLETPLARDILPGGREATSPAAPAQGPVYAGYPAFNAHPSYAAALAGAGVDVAQTANNHALDRGPLGVDRTLEALAEAGLLTTGTLRRGTAGPWHTVVQTRVGRIALLACTYSVNGLPDPAGQALRCYGTAPAIPTLIAQLVADPGIDAAILLPHWGQEYSRTPDAQQRRLARAAIEAGAAAVIGSHPHVLQPIEELMASDGRTAFVAYSLGNFISSQWSLDRRTGAILYTDLTRDAQGRVVANPPRALPTRVNRYVESGVTVTPAGLVADGAPSIAQAASVLGEGRLLNPSDFGYASLHPQGAACR
ncbi:CapA family protein [Roseicyclus mahoneyensis]|uniref:Poly-gamma-glutamate synthesis protein (Capsule biosynthesis protein) n=1 Tax=Roseicyclus mahoneyensis TaxID=164332 RepID=A0A316G4F8_9RHOB|nr:CapA family protein [Roseicyclus mahoneyensis]PWK55573.1 poly-gamma-glutamate synthesis protein (capsule biosynthesis protein) [Roseicyclus mahoneyensis]